MILCRSYVHTKISNTDKMVILYWRYLWGPFPYAKTSIVIPIIKQDWLSYLYNRNLYISRGSSFIEPNSRFHRKNKSRTFPATLCKKGTQNVSRHGGLLVTTTTRDDNNIADKQRVLMHRHQGWNVRHGLCHIYMRYLYIYELFIAFVCSLL